MTANAPSPKLATARQGHATAIHGLLASVEDNPYGFAARVIEKGGQEHVLTYGELCRLVGATAEGLAARGVGHGDRVIIAVPGSRAFLACYLAAQARGVIPLVVAEPKRDRPARVHDLARACDARLAILPGEAADEFEAVLPCPVVTADALRQSGGRDGALAVVATADGIAHLQGTSGSTGTPKLAIVRHRNVVANVEAIAKAVDARRDDVLVSWLPLSHDMGLIGLSYALYHQIPIVLSDTANFVRNPLAWPEWISRFGGTLSPAPNSAFQMCARLAALRPPRGLDLSSWRVALCGAEPVHESTLKQFTTAFAPSGLRKATPVPVYGLAEATLAVTMSDIRSPFTVDRVDAEAVASKGIAEPAQTDGERSLSMVCVGAVVDGHELRIADEDGAPLGERRVGEIEYRGPSVIDGYWQNDVANADLKRPDGFLRTGDLGYLADGKLYVTGRKKDLLIIGGRNFTPNQIESFVEAVAKSTVTPAVIAVGIPDETTGTEALHLLLDTRLADEDGRKALEARIRDGLADAFDLTGVGLHWIAAGRLPKTTSGKIQRFQCRRLVEDLQAGRDARAR